MRDQKREVLAAMEFFGIDPNKPVTEDDFERVRTFVWERRKHAEEILRNRARCPDAMPKLVDANQRKGPESKPEEILLWAMNSRSLLIGEFKPQVRVGPYFLDFGFPNIKLGIEVDGREFHSSPADQARDRRRASFIASCGWLLLRFSASDVMRNSMTIADKISQAVSSMQRRAGIKEAWDR